MFETPDGLPELVNNLHRYGLGRRALADRAGMSLSTLDRLASGEPCKSQKVFLDSSKPWDERRRAHLRLESRFCAIGRLWRLHDRLEAKTARIAHRFGPC